jgi:hypothetical protein
MNKSSQLHQENNEMLSKSSFLKKEIDFLLKLVQKEYSHSLNSLKYHVLDSYSEMLTNASKKLNLLNSKILNNEREVDKSYHSIYEDLNYISFKEGKNAEELDRITSEIATIKGSLTEFLNTNNQ